MVLGISNLKMIWLLFMVEHTTHYPFIGSSDENEGWISFWDVKDMIIYEDPILSNLCLDDSKDSLRLYGLTRNPLETLLRKERGLSGKASNTKDLGMILIPTLGS
jgi:hypothetical protein